MANLPADTTQTFPSGDKHVMQPQLQDVIASMRSNEAFLSALQAAVASSSTWGQFQTAVAALTL